MWPLIISVHYAGVITSLTGLFTGIVAVFVCIVHCEP